MPPVSGREGVLPVILSAAKDLFGRLARSFAALRMTGLLSKCLVLSYGLHLCSYLMGPEVLLATEVWAQCSWNLHAAIGLLVCFQERQHDARRGDSGIVECVHEPDLSILIAVADIRPAGLPVVKVRARMRLTIPVLAWQPAFKVVHTHFTIAHITCADVHDAIGQF